MSGNWIASEEKKLTQTVRFQARLETDPVGQVKTLKEATWKPTKCTHKVEGKKMTQSDANGRQFGLMQ